MVLPSVMRPSWTMARASVKGSSSPDGKQQVASVAAGLVRPGGALILDGGTTALAVAHAL